MSEHGSTADAALRDLFSYPLLTCLAERRTRRVARGTSIDAGTLSHHSTNAPAPLSRLEEAILIVCTGATGLVSHDGPLKRPDGGPELGTPYIGVVGRTASSPDAAQATSFFMTNDEGIWLLRHPRDAEAVKLLGELPPRWSDWRERDWIAAADLVKVQVSSQRLDFPREYPYYLGWNKQTSNRPGTTVFLPVVDCTWQYINALLTVLSEPDGQRPFIIDDFRRFHPKGFLEHVVWLLSKLRLAPPIPFQPVGGLKWIRSGYVNRKNPVPLGYARAMRTDYEAFFQLHNLTLIGQALGLGAWLHSSIFPPYIYMRDPAKGWNGLGFRMAPATPVRNMPPVPGSQPNPVGIDGILEGLCPPYVKSMDEAVDRFLERKYGGQGTYGDVATFARTFRDPAIGEAYLRQAVPFSEKAIEYTREICNYIYDTYGRFPAHVDAFYMPGVWVQLSHLELEYYEKTFLPQQYTRQAGHDAIWHPAR